MEEMTEDERRELKRMDDELQIQRKRIHDLANVVGGIPALQLELEEMHNDVKTGTAGLHAKLDLANQQFNQHLREDTKQFTTLELAAEALKGKITDSYTALGRDIAEVERRRKEASDKRDKTETEQRASRDQWKLAKYVALFALVTALVAAWFTNYLESKSQRTVLEQIRAEQKK